MNKKEIAKRYLISSLFLFTAGCAVLAALIFAANRLGGKFSFDESDILSAAVIASLVPLGSYTGFVALGTRVNEIKTKHAVLLIVFFPVVLVFVTVFGIIMIIPYTVKSVIDLFRG